MRKLAYCRFWRTLVPATGLVLVGFLLSKYIYPLPTYTEALLWYSRLDPFLAVSHLRTATIPDWIWLPILTVVLTLLFGRIFCGWLCPLGGLLAVLHSVKVLILNAVGKKSSTVVPVWISRLAPMRLPWFLFLTGILLLGIGWPMYFTPLHLLTEELSRIWRQQIPWMLVLLIVLGLVTFPRFWCVYVCPTGLLFTFISHWRVFRAKPPENCIHCGLCEKICPTGAANPTASLTTTDCLLCGRCSENCPVGHFVITQKSPPPSSSTIGHIFSRREILRSASALVIAGAATPLLSRHADANPLRPPGSLEEEDFLSHCSRCGRCIKVCPSQCISPMPLSSGAGLFLTPHIIPRQARCELCQQCQKVCPTGAIAPVPIPQVLMGTALIDHSLCLGWAQGKLCLVCKEQCPQHAIDSDSQNRPSVQAEKCVGCGGCENACPVDPAAIVVKPQSKRRHGKMNRSTG